MRMNRGDKMSKYALTIAYDGTALQNGIMDVKELAPALLAFGSLLEEANKELNGSDSKMQILVKSDFKTGSFHVDFEIVRTLADQIGFLWNNARSHSVEEILNTIGLIATITGLNPITLFGLFKLIKGRKIKKGTTIEDNNIRLEFEDNSKPVIVEKKIYQLFINLNILSAVQNVLKPLQKEGIERFFSQKDGKIESEITKSEVSYYCTPEISKLGPGEEKIIESTSKAVFKIVTASFEEGYKWRLTNGQDRITATLKDQAFIDKIDNNEVSLSKEDLLIVKMRSTQWHSQDGNIKTENEILQVIEHKKRVTQLAIPFFDDNK